MLNFDTTVTLMIEFMRQNGLMHATIKDSAGDRASIKQDKHGFFHVTKTEQHHIRS